MSSESGKKTTLTQALNTTATTIYLASPPTTYPGRGFMENGNIKEWVSYTGVTSTSITGVVRGLSQTADPITGGTGLAWNAGTSFRVVFMHDQLPDKTRPFPIYSGTTAVLAALTGVVTYSIAYDTTLGQYVYYNGSAWTSFATGTVADASSTVAGKVEIATSAESIAGTDTGGTGSKLSVLPSDIAKNAQSNTFNYGTDVGGDDTYVVVLTPASTTNTDGARRTFTPTTTNTGACSVNFGGGVLNIKTKDGLDPQNGVLRALTPVTGTIYGSLFILDNEDFATTANKGTVEMATDAEAIAITDQTRYVNPYQLGLVANPNAIPNTLVTSTSYMTYQFMPTVNATTNIVSNGWTESGAVLAADQGGAGYLFLDSGASAPGYIMTTLPGIGSNTALRWADIGANAISIKSRMKVGTVPAIAGETIGFGLGTSTGIWDPYTGTELSIGFVVTVNSGVKLYAKNANGTTNTNTNITGSLTLTNWNMYEMVITSSSILFYVNGTLAATHTTNLPTSTNAINIGWGNDDNGTQPDCYISPILISLPTS